MTFNLCVRNLQKRRTIRSSKEEAKKLKSNGVRISKAETPESVTLSVDSLPVHRKSIPEPDWASPKPRNSLIIIPEPPPPPPVPPHKTPMSVHSNFEPSRPSRSNLTSGRKCASREDLTDRVASDAVAKSDRSLHRSVGSELPKLADHYCQWQQQLPPASASAKQPQQSTAAKSVKSPSSSESSRKRHGVTNLSSANHRDPWAVTASAYPPSSSNRKEDLSSPGTQAPGLEAKFRGKLQVVEFL